MDSICSTEIDPSIDCPEGGVFRLQDHRSSGAKDERASQVASFRSGLPPVPVCRFRLLFFLSFLSFPSIFSLGCSGEYQESVLGIHAVEDVSRALDWGEWI